MKKQISILFIGIATLMASCSSDEPTPALVQPTLPGSSDVRVKSITHRGNMNGCYDWQFAYTGTRLTSASATLYNPTSVNIQYGSQLIYGENSVSIVNTGNLAMGLTLDENHNITYLTANKDEYRFVYNEGRLTAWDKIVKDVNFGADVSRARADIEYVNGDLKTIAYYENNDAPTYYRFTPSDIPNTNGLLPELMSKPFGCFGFEHLYYAGLMGNATKRLVKSIEIDYPEASGHQDYELHFNYSVNKDGMVELCTFTYNGEAARADYTY